MNALDRDVEKAELETLPSRAKAEDTGREYLVSRQSSRLSSLSTTTTSSSYSDDGDALERHPTALSRIATQRSQHSGTVGADVKARVSEKPLPPFGAGKPYPPPLPQREEYVVEFDGPRDPLHPQNWPRGKKLITACVLGYTTFCASFASSIFSPVVSNVAEVHHVSSEVALLGLSLYVLGFATGPVFWAPLSELRGRRLPILLGMFGFTVFQFAVATAKDLQTILISRFFGGFFGACPITVVAAVFSDILNNNTRGLGITIFSMAVFNGPLVAPLVGGFITESHLGWRWTSYLTGIMGAAALVLDLFLFQETYPPLILVQKAAELRRRTKNWGIHAKQEEIEIDFAELIHKNFSRPLRLLFTEPIVFLLSVYMAFLYGLLYLFMTSYAIVFQQVHGFDKGIGGLPYLGIAVGEFLGGAFIIAMQPWYTRKLRANNNIPVPEWRLPPAIVGAIAFAAGLFWFGWTGYTKNIHWIAPTLSGLLTGFGLMSIFLQCINYLIDAYLVFAASAIAANAILRSIAGAGFPLFATYMYNDLGVNWAGTLLGCVASVMAPIPIAFYLYGPKIRARSRFAPTFESAAAAHCDDD
ncbi:hypothetical protein VTN31DRAFT_888 [Thermomyces dupontii]|uniref:uncharacterized protein n=1 Tax=Talaromyces thermophilus TaxID=28565 RepID=UPI003742117B